MYEKELNQLIKLAPNITTIRVYNMLINMEQFKGGVVVSRKYVSEELNLSIQHTSKAFQWLIKAKFITETTLNGYNQFILNKLEDKVDKKAEKTEETQVKTSQKKQEVVKKGGKTIVRTMVPGF